MLGLDDACRPLTARTADRALRGDTLPVLADFLMVRLATSSYLRNSPCHARTDEP